MKFEKTHMVYMLGIGGIGMSGLARYFLSQGKTVLGYDRVSTRLTDDLIREGARIHFTEDPAYISEQVRDASGTLVIYTPAIPETNLEFAWLKKLGFEPVKRASILGILSEEKRGLAIAGTHGKTTVSSMINHLMISAGVSCSSFLGGISKNYKTNAVISAESEWIVMEADEYDRSFLKLFPELAVITSCEADHLDIYGNRDALVMSFRDFAGQINDQGALVYHRDIDPEIRELAPRRTFSYSLDGPADYCLDKIRIEGGKHVFDVSTPEGIITGLRLGLPGRFNVENALPAICIGQLMGIDLTTIRKALESFTGVQRRFDVQFEGKGLVYIDDYAHHPTELAVFIASVKEIYPDRKITGVFQPHLYSRTRDFADGFVSSLDLLDEVILLEIYPAREQAIEGVNSGMIFDRLSLNKKVLINKEQLIPLLKERKPEVLLTMGAGDIDQLVGSIRDIYMEPI